MDLVEHYVVLLQPDSSAASRRTVATARARATVEAIQTVQDLEAYLSVARPEEWEQE